MTVPERRSDTSFHNVFLNEIDMKVWQIQTVLDATNRGNLLLEESRARDDIVKNAEYIRDIARQYVDGEKFLDGVSIRDKYTLARSISKKETMAEQREQAIQKLQDLAVTNVNTDQEVEEIKECLDFLEEEAIDIDFVTQEVPPLRERANIDHSDIEPGTIDKVMKRERERKAAETHNSVIAPTDDIPEPEEIGW